MIEPARDSLAESGRAPLVTIAMPVYNAGHYLRPAVMSILQQTFSDWELIIIDDGSSDGATESIGDILDSRVVVLRDGLNKGLAARLNEAIDLARGRYLARMDQDDISYPERLARQVEMLEHDRDIDLLSVGCIAIDEESETVGVVPRAVSHEEACLRPWLGFYLPHPTWMGRIEWFCRHRYANPGPYFCEDQELLLRSFRSSRFAILPETLFAYRIRSSINWKKLVRIRITLLGLQLRHFSAEGNHSFLLYSALACCARLAKDTLQATLQALAGNGRTMNMRGRAAAEDEARWSEVRRAVSQPWPGCAKHGPARR